MTDHLIGQPPAVIGSDGSYWCADLIRHLAPDLPWSSDPGPMEAAHLLPLGTGQPGDAVLIDLFPGNGDYAEHVAVLRSVNPDGSVTVVEANGAAAPGLIGLGHYPGGAVLGFRQLPAPAPVTTTTTTAPPPPVPVVEVPVPVALPQLPATGAGDLAAAGFLLAALGGVLWGWFRR